MKYMFYPFNDQPGRDQHEGIKEDWNQYAPFGTRHELFCGNTVDNSMRALTDQQLYIFGHSNRGIHKLYSWRRESSLEARELVLILSERKRLLPAYTGKIKIWACHSASHRYLLGYRTSDALVQEFANQMFDAGYVNCSFFGYSESIAAGYRDYRDGANNNRHKLTAVGDERVSAVRVQFRPRQAAGRV